MEKENFKVPTSEEKVGLPKIPEGTIYLWDVDGEGRTIVPYYFINGKWIFKEGKEKKEVEKEAQKILTEKYLENKSDGRSLKRT